MNSGIINLEKKLTEALVEGTSYGAKQSVKKIWANYFVILCIVP